MSRKIAVAIIHGVGKQGPNFAESTMVSLKNSCAKEIGKMSGGATLPDDALVMKPVYWEPIMQKQEDILWERVKAGGPIRWRKSRRFLIDYGADALAYQPTPWDRSLYDSVHGVFAETLRDLARDAGEDAPLCVIAHSLGSVIASNYFYDLYAELTKGRTILPESVKKTLGHSPLECGETLSLLYTLGSPIAVWALRYGVENFGAPITVPSENAVKHFPKEQFPDFFGEWVNYYDADDIIGFPLKTLNASYAQAVTEDKAVNVGSLFASLTPASHLAYLKTDRILVSIAQSLAKVWRAVNPE